MPVYLIQAGSDGPVKIGKADNPKDRLANLQVGCWMRLRLLRVWKGSTAEESSLHCRFADQAIMGDWFHFSKAMMRDVGLEDDDEWSFALDGVRPQKKVVQLREPSPEQTHHNSLLREIEDFLSTRAMAESTFGRLSVNDGKFVKRLRAGDNMTFSTMEKVRSYMRSAA